MQTLEISSKISEAESRLSTLVDHRSINNRQANELRKKIREQQYLLRSLIQAREEVLTTDA